MCIIYKKYVTKNLNSLQITFESVFFLLPFISIIIIEVSQIFSDSFLHVVLFTMTLGGIQIFFCAAVGQDSQDINSKLLVRFCQTHSDLLQMYDKITQKGKQSSEKPTDIAEVLHSQICMLLFFQNHVP